MLDSGGGGGGGELINFFPLKRGRGGGFNIGFTVYFTIIEVKKIIRRFFILRFHCIIRAYPYIVFRRKKFFLCVTFAG